MTEVLARANAHTGAAGWSTFAARVMFRRGNLGAKAPVIAALLLAAATTSTASASFPYGAQGGATDYSEYRLPAASAKPDDLEKKLVWMYASTAHPMADAVTRADKRELNGVRGAHVVDADAAAGGDQAWVTTTGRPDVTIAVLDSGIKWNDAGAMIDLRKKTRLSRGETPAPNHARTQALENGVDCATYGTQAGFDARDLNHDGVVNILDYACDSRVLRDTPKGVGPDDMLEPQDVLIAFSNGDDADGNGFVDDIVGWDFLDDDNDPFDDVQYGHGTGEAKDSGAEAANKAAGGGELGTCPNCMQIHLRVGTSFIADVNRFALATIYATDNDVQVVQEALGTLNKSRLGFDAIKYAYDHGTTVIASAADEAAQHHNWPSSYPYSIVVNSVTHLDETDNPLSGDTPIPPNQSYLQFNGCTNFSSRITLAIPSVSCSSDATGRASGMAGLVYSAALNALEDGRLEEHPTCVDTDGDPCVVTPNEVRQLMASGVITRGEGQSAAVTELSDDVNFAQDPLTGTSTELSCQPVPAPGCSDPFGAAPTTRVSVGPSYPARRGHDQFYGYGRVNMNKVVDAIVPPSASEDAIIPPEVEITSPGWYDMVDPAGTTMKVRGHVFARGQTYRCRVYVAAGAYPRDRGTLTDFKEMPASGACDGSPKTQAVSGELADVELSLVKALFPAATVGAFNGREPGNDEQHYGGRPNTEPYAFTVKVVASVVNTAAIQDVNSLVTGEDRRQAYLHRDAAMLPGFPKQLPGDGEASPVLADLDGDNMNELVIANSDGEIHAFRRDGSELDGFPAHTDLLPLHPDSPAFAGDAIAPAHGAVLATPAVGDIDHDGTPEIVVGDLESKVYVFSHEGEREDSWTTNLDYSGVPLEPFVNVRKGSLNRTQMGFIGAPVLADLDRDDGGKMEIIAAAMDRHTYAWNHDGSDVPGWPVLVVDRTKVQSIDPVTHQVTFKPDSHAEYDQGALIGTPAVGNIDDDPAPEVVVGSNESYDSPNVDPDEFDEENPGLPEDTTGEPFNAGGVDTLKFTPMGAALSLANGRLFAIEPEGDDDPLDEDTGYVDGWPFRVGILQAGVLPLVGEGITGSPIIGNVECRDGAKKPRVGVIPAAGLGYIVDANGQSCYGRDGEGKDNALPSEGGDAADQPFLPAFGHPAFADIGGVSLFLAPAAGVKRAVDVVLPEYQGGNDYLVGWNTGTGEVAPGWPAEMNDLQFLTGPSIAEVDQAPGADIVAGSAHHDLQGFTAAGTDLVGWPKVTGDWTVANPVIGSWGTQDYDATATKVVVGLTRMGRIQAYEVPAKACAAAPWPQFHHDPANSGDARRDAVAPGAPHDEVLTSGDFSFTAPGDDLLCGTVTRYEARTSDAPLTAENFESASGLTISGAGVLKPAGQKQTMYLAGPQMKRYIGVRAVDDAGNVSRPVIIDRKTPDPDPDPDPDPSPTATATASATPDATATATATPSATATPTATARPVATPTPRPGTASFTPGIGNEVATVRRACAPRSAALRTDGLGSFRLGASVEQIIRAVGAHTTTLARALRWCVTDSSRARVTVVFSATGRARLVATTAARHPVAGLRTRMPWSQASRKVKLVKIAKNLYVLKRDRRVVVGRRTGRVRFLAVADRSLSRNRDLLVHHVRRLGAL